MNKEIYATLDMMLRPAFCVVDGIIEKVNLSGRSFGLEPGMHLQSLLLTGQEELDTLTHGCLYLQLSLPSGEHGAAASRIGDAFILILDQESGELRSLALAARDLRSPLNSLLALSGSMLPNALPGDDPKITDLMSRMSRELYRLQRIVSNMSDAPQAEAMSCQETRNLAQVFEDIFEKAAALLAQSGISLEYTGLNQDVFGLLDTDQMERAVLNVLSNAAKFCIHIQASLTRHGNTLRLSILDEGPGIPEDILGSLFQRYLRQPGIEDPRHGLGLGMVMIRAAAASHGGTVLVDSPQGSGTRVTLTIKIRHGDGSKVQSPRQDLSGGRDQALIELSQLLPVSIYEKEL